jgi:hypothetical protein
MEAPWGNLSIAAGVAGMPSRVAEAALGVSSTVHAVIEAPAAEGKAEVGAADRVSGDVGVPSEVTFGRQF